MSKSNFPPRMPAGTKDLLAYAVLMKCHTVGVLITEAMHGGEHELEMVRAMLAKLERIKKEIVVP